MLFWKKPALCGLLLLCAPFAFASNAQSDFDFLIELLRRRYVNTSNAADFAQRIDCMQETFEARGSDADIALHLDALTDRRIELASASGWRRVPAETDLLAAFDADGTSAHVISVRPRSAVMQMNIRVGDKIIAVNEVPVAQTVRDRLPRCAPTTATTRDWALQSVLAGQRDAPRKLTLQTIDGRIRAVWLSAPSTGKSDAKSRRAHRRRDDIAVIALSDLVGSDAIKKFDAQLARYREASAIILDLREVSSEAPIAHAETFVARFIDAAQIYQLRQLSNGATVSQSISPRGNFAFMQPIAVILSPWSGATAQQIAAALHALRNAPIIGAPMHWTDYETESFTLPVSKQTIDLPIATLRLPDGRARQEINLETPSKTDYGGDAVFATAARRLRQPR